MKEARACLLEIIDKITIIDVETDKVSQETINGAGCGSIVSIIDKHMKDYADNSTDRIVLFMGKPVSYWAELNDWAISHGVEEVVTENANLRVSNDLYKDRQNGLISALKDASSRNRRIQDILYEPRTTQRN